MYQARITPVFLSIIKYSAEENLNRSLLEEESMKGEKLKAVLLLTVLDSIMFKMFGVEDIILLLKLKKEKTFFIILGVRMTKDNLVSVTSNHKLILFKSKP